MENIGLDLGYSAVKIVSLRGKRSFPSLVGTGETEIKVMGTSTMLQIVLNDKIRNVGKDAIMHSRFPNKQEDRFWYESDDYTVLFYAALSEILGEGTHDVTIVTGLPVAFYEADKDKLKEKLEGIHHINRVDRNTLTVNVSMCHVIPQPMGTLANIALADTGQIDDSKVAMGAIGVIDIGGKTTNLMHASEMGAIDRETESINLGGWDAVRAFTPILEEYAPDGGYKSHEIEQMIIDKHVKYRGNEIDLSLPLDEVFSPMAQEIISKAKELWPGQGARLDTILLSGGGANLLGDYIKEQIEHGDIRVVDDSTFANANGYYKLAQFLGLQKTQND